MHDEFVNKKDDKVMAQIKSRRDRENDLSGLSLEAQGYKNMVQIIDWNERRHQYVAK